MEAIEVVQSGLLTTVQDAGRLAWAPYGFSESGALDLPALQLGNQLLGNAPHTAGLEITVQGPLLRFYQALSLALTGADLGAELDGRVLPLGRPVRVEKGQSLLFRGRRSGARAYITVAGGLQVPRLGGSAACDLRAGLPGLLGRALKPGDFLAVGKPRHSWQQLRGRSLPEAASGDEQPLRVVLGPDLACFSPADIRRFFADEYRVSPVSNRMGYRLEGPALAVKDGDRLLSEPQPFGTIQVPPDGRPVILLADRQTVGGYAKIGVVISADRSRLAQRLPGESIRFAPTTVSEARRLLAQEVARVHPIDGGNT